MALLLPPGYRINDRNGDVVAAGRLYVYLNRTTTLADIYSDPDLSIPLDNPMDLDGGGLAINLYAITGKYTIRAEYSDTSEVWTRNDYFGWNDLSALTYETVADAKADSLEDGTSIYIKGIGRYFYDESSSATANGGTIITPDSGTGRLILEPSERVTPETFGGGTGVADNAVALNAAFAGASVITIPEGVYNVTVSADNLFTLPDNTVIEGAGDASVLRFNLDSADVRTIFNVVNAGVVFRNLMIEIGTSVSGATIVGFHLDSGMTFCGVTIDGMVTGAGSHLFQVLKCSNTVDWTGLVIKDCYWHHITRCWLRENTATSDVSDIQVTDSLFADSRQAMFAMNGPLGSIDGLVFSGNIFRDPFIDTVQSDGYFIGPQAQNVTIVGNQFLGTGQEAIHIEENANDLAITGNVIDMDAVRGIYISDNNVSGGTLQPTRVTVVGNTVNRSDASQTGTGIELVNDGGAAPGLSVIVSDNAVEGWEYGIACASEQDDRVLIRGNVVHDCDQGARLPYGLPTMEDNVFSACGVGVQTTQGGGAIGKNSFHNCTTIGAATNGELSFQGFKVLSDRLDIAPSGNAEISILPMGANDRFDGFLNAHTYGSSAIEDHLRDEINWDGTTFTDTAKITYGGGSIVLSLVDVSSVLTVRGFNGGTALTAVAFYVEFDGLYVVA